MHCSIDTELEWHISVEGDKGTLKISQPWHPGPENNHIVISDKHGNETVHKSDDMRPLYAIEADHVGDLIARKAQSSDLVTPDFSINTAYWLDRWRETGGVIYAADRLAATGFHGAALKHSANGSVPRVTIDGLDKPISKLVLGTDNQIDAPTMAAMGDAFFEAGGT